MSPVELRRILGEWRLRVQRIKDILQPASWTETEWRQFSQALALLVRDHGKSWIIDPNVYWDLRWKLQDGGELVCQVEHIPGEKTSLVVAQTGGFAQVVDSYTWLWAEFDLAGEFSRDPYWVDGTWKDALTTLLLPLDRQSSFLLAGRTATPESLLLQEGARPNDGNFHLALPAGYSEEKDASESAPPATEPPPPPEPAANTPSENRVEGTAIAADSPAPIPAPSVPGEGSPPSEEKAAPVSETEIPTSTENGEGAASSPESIPVEPAPSISRMPRKAEPKFILSESEVRFRRLRARSRYALTVRKSPPRISRR